MHCYNVTVKPMTDSFTFLRLLDPDAVIDLICTEDGVELYDINTVADIAALLDQQPGIVSYTEFPDSANADLRV